MKAHFTLLLIAISAGYAMSQTAKQPIELQHMDVTRVDSAVNPCGNFYQYACSKLNAANPIPPNQMMWGVADLKAQGKTLEDKDEHGLTNLQRFFIAYGTSWCDTFRPELMQTLVKIDPHSMPVLRVNNVLANMPEFQKVFNCKAGQSMVHETRCRVW